MKFQGLLIDLKTSPTIQKALVDGIKWLIATNTDPNNQPFAASSNAARYQSKMGWQHLFRGFVAKKWQEEQQQYTILKYPQTDDDSPRAQWATKVTQFLLKTSHEIWLEGCTVVHHKTSKQESEHEALWAATKLRAIYRYSDAVNALDRENIFGIDLDIRLQNSAQEILTWCATINPALTRARKDYTKEMEKGQRKINEFPPRCDDNTKIPTQRKRSRRRHSSAHSQSSTDHDSNNPT